MKILQRTNNILRLLFRKQRLEDDLDAEVHAHLAMLVDKHLASGLSLEHATRAARIELEGVEQVKEQVREVRVGANIESSLQDVRYALRTLRKNKGFAAVTVLTLALGIGVNAAIFTVVYTVLLRPLPYAQPDRLALIWSNFHKTGADRAPTSGPALAEIKRRTSLLQDVAAIWVGNATFTGELIPEQVKVAFVTPNFLGLLGVPPALGRVFAVDEKFSGRSAVVLTNGLWKRRFGGDPSIVGKAIRFAGSDATVIGVMPEDFQLHFPSDSNVPAEVGAFAPYGDDIYKGPRTLYYLRLLARMKPGVTTDQAQQDLNQAAAQIRGAYTEFAEENMALTLAPLQRDAVRDVRPALIALFAGAVFVLLICWVNVANLLLARSSDRTKEIAVRSALGASKARILRQLVIEGMLLCALAGALGIALGWAGLHALLRIRPDYLARMPDVGIDWPVLGFVTAISLAAVILFAMAPTFESAKDMVQSLRESGRTSRTPARRSLRAALIVAEIALGFVLVIGACLMVRTLVNVHRVRPGFEPRGLLTFELDLGRYGRSAALRFVEDWESQVAALAGVEAVGATSHLPLDDYPNWYSAYRPEGVTATDGAALLADHRCVTPGYFHAMGARLIEGRFFDQQDNAAGRQVVIIDELLARSSWPGQSAIGKKVESEHFTNKGIVPVWAEVIGVVEHVRNHSLSKQLRGEIYIPFEQSQRGHLSFAVRTRMDPLSLAGTIQQELRKRDRELALSKVRPMTAYIERATAPLNFTTVLASIFAVLALSLAALGIYGLSSYSVSRRMHELGVRMALGASARQVVGLVMREGLGLTAAGMALGLAGSLLAARYLRALIYGVSALDPLTYALAIVVIPAAAILGCWRPARRAASMNPVEAIRTE